CRASCDSDESLGHILQRHHQTHHTRITRHDILRHLKKRISESVILDAQVVGTRFPLSDAHAAKCSKYSFAVECYVCINVLL
ncbi:uncharacterized protein LOC142568593, partial [Dermacentor variabilis]|uniref:uncharacterized protein LOC142568593 n=1 Tax=Dermacentor variabilis TaxID=34621 RepID=UPI003F5B7D6C